MNTKTELFKHGIENGMLTIKIASLKDFHLIRDFYHHLIDELKDRPHKPKWTKGIYPSDDYLKEALVQKELFVGSLDDTFCAAMIVNQKYHAKYNNIQWPTKASKEEIAIIHAMGVSPAHSKKGFASQMVKEVIRRAKMQKLKAIRLDVLLDNLPAMSLYEKLGFQYIDTLQMDYPDTGWAPFKLYEYSLLPTNETKSPLGKKIKETYFIF